MHAHTTLLLLKIPHGGGRNYALLALSSSRYKDNVQNADDSVSKEEREKLSGLTMSLNIIVNIC